MSGTGQVVDEMPSRKGPNSKYDWEVIADGNVRKMVRGDDFSSTVEGFRSTVLAHASAEGIAVRTHAGWTTTDDGEKIRALWLQFYPGRKYGDVPN